jgi:N-acyl homoserine lactone hydrolase
MLPLVEAPNMWEGQRIPRYLKRLGLGPQDVDVVFISHLHFDHVGGLHDLPGCTVHVQADELAAARTGTDGGVFADELVSSNQWEIKTGEYLVAPGVHAISSPGHTAGHMSLFIELQKGPPVILCGDAADLKENLVEEIAPGYCWQDNESLALDSIRKLKVLENREKGQLWPNHDMDFFLSLPRFPACRD